MSIDLHAHTDASDGTDAPAELVRNARAAGLDVVAITDHDTVNGWAEAAEAVPAGLTLVPGAEISCVWEGISLHLLAYLFDPGHEVLGAEMAMALDDRVPRAKAIVAKLADAGHPITWDLVLAQLKEGATVGRPHIADTLVELGVVHDRNEAFVSLLHDDGPFFVSHYYVDAVLAVRLVREAGGVPVFAHPAASKRGPTVGDDAIQAMAEAGLAGLEIDHRDNPREERRRLHGLAHDLNLLVTGASDYHGDGKPNRLGENRTDPDVFTALVAQATGAELVVA